MRKGMLWAAAAFIAAGVVSASSAQAVTVYALTDENDLISFDSATPNDLLSGGAITGALGHDFLGIDFSPINGRLYGVTNLGSIYEINTATLAATFVSSVSVSLSGSRYGIDVEPVTGKLRITSDLDQNLSVDIPTGVATVGTSLVYGPAQPGATGDNPSVTASAYAGSTLYDIDVRDAEDRLVLQSGNAGVLTVVGPTGINASSVNGFDIYHDGEDFVGVAALQQTVEGINKFYTINLTTGAATFVGDIGGGDLIDGIAVVVPEPTTLALTGLALTGLLARRRRRG